ncbi:sperm motility kinase Z-like [Arvicanthis niloticus]|uniref:sperm motility kinase Z-like n=1 Tax=Arvicanthis niloticus TaxID=61156 RepID=UPI0014874F8F|nr:sperm motility kinase Z-like [Arvicanthis niloticus]
MYSDSDDESSEASSVHSLFNEEVFTRQYTVLMPLGQGGTTEVRLSFHRLTGTPVAIKALVKCEGRWEQILLEVEIMKTLSHPNIVSLLQVIETEQNIYLIMELAQGEELLSRVRKAGCLKEDEARSIFVQLLSAIGYCHGEGVVHRDLKPDNIIVDDHGKVKIIDFGLGARFMPGEKLKRLCGALQFIPPEIFIGLPYDGPKVDIWALGVILYHMVTGFVPFPANTLRELSQKVLQGRYEVPSHLSKNLRSIISRLLSVNSRQRPTAEDLLSHPWLQEQGKTFASHSNGDTSFPDPDIMVAMQNIGFHAQDIRESLQHKKFDETMATYQLLRMQACQDDGNYDQTKLMNPGVTPFPSAADLDTFPLPPRRRASEPSLKTLVSNEQHHLRQSGGTNAPVSHKKTPTMGMRQKRSMTAPCIYLRRNTAMDIEDTSFSTSSRAGKALSNSEQSGTSTSSSLEPRGWAKWKKRIGACIRTLCCCVSPHNKYPRKVCPQK